MVKMLQTLFKRKLCPEHHQESRHRKDKGKTDSHVQTEPGFSSLGGAGTFSEGGVREDHYSVPDQMLATR